MGAIEQDIWNCDNLLSPPRETLLFHLELRVAQKLFLKTTILRLYHNIRIHQFSLSTCFVLLAAKSSEFSSLQFNIISEKAIIYGLPQNKKKALDELRA